VQGPGGEAGVMRVKGTKRGLAMALDGNGRWCYLDPKQGAKLAVAEAARKVACTGAVPVAATNCLNFGNPEKPEIMAQLSAAIDGIAEACTALGTPITGGNVSLYNETKGEGIYPTPVIGIVGILEDVTKAVPADFQRAGEDILVIGQGAYHDFITPIALRQLGSSEFATGVLHKSWGEPVRLDLQHEASLHKCLQELSAQELITSASDVSSGGVAVALAQACFAKHLGIEVEINPVPDALAACALFGEFSSYVIVTCSAEKRLLVQALVETYDDIPIFRIGQTTGGRFALSVSPGIAKDEAYIDCSIGELKSGWANALQSTLSADTVTA
jgi:phosphoribosylformylglycinamidine (FGAM) synthase-like enzyme